MSDLGRSLIDAAAEAIRDAYEELPDGTKPEFTEVHEWHGEARAALVAIFGALALDATPDTDIVVETVSGGTSAFRRINVVELAAEVREGTP